MDARDLVDRAVDLHREMWAGRATITQAERFAGLRGDLWATVTSDEHVLVDDLEMRWEALRKAASPDADQYDALRAKLDEKREPALLCVDLLGLLGRARKEVLHTQALGAFLDPRRAGQLGADLLAAFLAVCDVGRVPGRDVLESAIISVEPADSDSGTRPDIAIDMGDLAVIIENKIDTVDREGQLSGYAEAARRRRPGCRLRFVYLTPLGEVPEHDGAGEWFSLGYLLLAVRWRRILYDWEARAADDWWVEALRGYLATLVRHVCPVCLTASPGEVGKSRAVPYLKSAVGEPP